MVDQLTDMLVRLKNGQKKGLNSIVLRKPASKLCLQLLDVLQREGYIYNYSVKQEKPLSIEVKLKYTLLGTPVITEINRISKPSKRVYINSKSLWNLNSGMGIFIISTPKGLMTDLDAKIINQGGEILCSVL
jgi:small subunit ribosomal protein S8